ncbi:GlcG/HbpS family heme-binding protein [Sphingomonas sp.]|uniref:GlcG/HbpS family heme-binding protein n=1 Tax=Sphingomonas sp. TaxID=28214 RepID=UPI003D6D04F0
MALVAAKAAAAACTGSRIGVAIIDSAGMPKLFYIPDGTTGYHAYTGFRKAWTALTFRMPTSEVGALTRANPAVRARIVDDSNFLSFAGGLPIFVKHELIGAIGVSGAEPSATDERCAVIALGKIQSRLR